MDKMQRPNKLTLQVARTVLAEAAHKPWLAALLAQQQDWLEKLRIHIQRLTRPQRLGLRRKLASGLAAAVLLAALVGAPPAFAGTISVDGVTCTLNNAIITANSGVDTGGCIGGSAAADIINLTVDVTLSAELPSVTTPITIDGGAGGHFIDSINVKNQSVLRVSAAGDLTLNRVTVKGGEGAALLGGGIYSQGALTITNSTISGNSASYGGGIYIKAGTATITNSTISGNSATTNGGGIETYVDLNLQNSTVSGNSAALGGGIYVKSYTTTIENSTIAYNTAASGGGGIFNYSVVNLKNTIVAMNGQSCKASGGTWHSQGYNISSDSSCYLITTGDQQNVAGTALKLLALAANGGLTQTHALGSGSVALEQITSGTNGCGTAYTADQRGYARPGTKNATGKCEVGAWEAQIADPTQIALQSFSAMARSPQNALAALVTLIGGAIAALAVRFRLRSKI